MKTKTQHLYTTRLRSAWPNHSSLHKPMDLLTRTATIIGKLVVLTGLAASLVISGENVYASPNPPPGFKTTVVTAAIPSPSSLAFGPDGQLYVCALGPLDATFDGKIWVVNPMSGATHVFGDIDGIDDPQGDLPTGILVDRDGTVFVSDSHFDSTSGHNVGFVRALRDTNGDSVADVNEVVLDGLPNGRHDNNNMAFGPDGYIYLTNGSRTDDGIHGSLCLSGGVPGIYDSCPGEDAVYSGTLLRVDPKRRNQRPSDTRVVARGMRNIYDVAFWPKDPRYVYIPMNGSDEPEADDLLFRTKVIDGKVDDMGWPSCLYNIGPVNGYPLIPAPNPVPGVAEMFGPCDDQ